MAHAVRSQRDKKIVSQSPSGAQGSLAPSIHSPSLIDKQPATESFADSGPPDDQSLASFARPALAGVAALSVAACGGGDSSTSPPPIGGPVDTPVDTPVEVRKPESDAEAARFMLRASLGASTGGIEQLRSEGFEPWLDSKMGAANSPSAREFISINGLDQVDSERHYERSDRGDWMIWSQLLTDGNSLRKRFALALSEYFVVSITPLAVTWPASAVGEYWDILSRNAFGNFRDLLEEITLCPAMGLYLNTRGNRKADPTTGRVPDENYGREIMQLFTIGLFELNPDGTLKLSGGEPIETYGNDDVTGIAKVFTGYDFDFADATYTLDFGGSYPVPDASVSRVPMTADASRWQYPSSQSFHSEEEKQFLGLTIPAGTGPVDSLRLALDHLFSHPNVGPFFSKQMIQKLVTSNPSPAYVQRVAAIFDDNGQGQRGDLGAVYKAILLDDEALDPDNATSSTFGKLREPMLRYIQLARTFGAGTISGRWEVTNQVDPATRLGQSPLRSPTVFNFFRPSYFPPNTQIAGQGLLAPEFQLVNDTTVASCVNFFERVVPGGQYPMADVTFDYSAESALAADPAALLNRLDLLLTGNQLTSATRDTILGAINSVSISSASDTANLLRRVYIAVLLILVSPDYLIQK